MVSTELKNIVESIIFASEEEVTSKQIKDIIDKSGLRISLAEVEESVNTLNDEYTTENKSFEILKIAGGFSFATKKEYGRFIGRLFEDKQRKKLSPSALETLAIIAYKQPITRSEMEFIRGVNVDYIVNSLLEKEMITIHGRADAPGRPILYGTTKNFLKVLGLNSLEDLPKLKEINEILKNQEIEGITEADIELFNSVNNPDLNKEAESGQLELISSEDSNDSFISENDMETLSITEGNISEDIEFNVSNSAELVIDETVNGETVNGETVNGETVNGETVNGETVIDEMVMDETVNGETVNGETVNGETVIDEMVKDETVIGETEPEININEKSEDEISDNEEFTGSKEESVPESEITENNEVEIFLKENETDKNESESKE